jgi:hypothetical protein
MYKFKPLFFLLIFLASCSSANKLQLVEFDCSDVTVSGMISLYSSEEFNIDSWVCSIEAIEDSDAQQAWYSNLILVLASQEGSIDVNLWYTIINKFTDSDIQQGWYSNLLGYLNLEAMNNSDVDLETMHLIVDELTDKELQKTWRTNIDGIKTLRLLNSASK